jgi:glyoxylase-like metal-dependent hydrolase (beta-lactamase superfamily II)
VKPSVTEVAADTFMIDCLFAGLPGQCGVFLLRGDRNVLIDTGPSVCIDNVLRGLAQLGVDAGAIDLVLLTHFHLDHAGATSFLLERSPGALVYVDPRSTRYMAEPERLVRSAQKSLGDVAAYYGSMDPVDPKRMVPLQDGQKIDLGGGRVLSALYTPGHSGGHFVFHDNDGTVFCGDSLGHFIARAGYVYPATPAPEFDMDLSLESARRLSQLDAELFLFPHFGSSRQPAEVIEKFERQLKQFVQTASEMPDATPERLADRLVLEMPLKDSERDVVRGIMVVNAAGILHYLERAGGCV